MNNSLASLMLNQLTSKIPTSQDMTSALLGVISDIELPDIDTSKNLFVVLKPSTTQTDSLEASLQYATKNNNVSIPIELKSNLTDIKLDPNQEIKIEAKLVSDNSDNLEMQIVNIKTPEAKKTQEQPQTQSSLIIKDTNTSLKNIETNPIKLELPNIKETPQIKLSITSIDPKQIATTPPKNIDFSSIQNITELKTALEQIKPQQIIGEVVKINISNTNEVKNYIKTQPQNQTQTPTQQQPQAQAQPQTTNTNQSTSNFFIKPQQESVPQELTFIKTPIGNVFLQKPINLPQGSPIILKIDDIVFEQKDATNDKQQNKILSTLEPIKQNHPEAFEKIINKIPSFDNNKILSNIVSNIKANISKDISDVIEPKIIQELNNSTPEVKEALKNFAELIIKDANEPPIKLNNIFRIIEVPLYNQGIFSKIKIAIKHDDNQENNKAKTKKSATRFVLETTFSNLGNFQFDGFAVKQDKRFDLILRTQNKMKPDFISQIMSIFNKSLTDVNYTGAIAIHNQEFLKVFETKTPAKQGIFI